MPTTRAQSKESITGKLWDKYKKVLRLTNTIGVDHIVKVGRARTLSKSLNSVRIAGHVAVTGVLMKAVWIQDILVDLRRMFEDSNDAIEFNRLRPIDRTFALKEAAESLRFTEGHGTST